MEEKFSYTESRYTFSGFFPASALAFMYLAAQRLEIPIRVMAKEGELIINTKVEESVPKDHFYAQLRFLPRESAQFWKEITSLALNTNSSNKTEK